ncbi:MAG: STAS-like domain-containing protein [Gammaproteobacteria bacterium]|nr:STAS-like domain-containing protein [Gammaproteobacteria bacterium]
MATTEEIRDSILRNVDRYPSGITAYVMDSFSLTRPAVIYHIQHLISEGKLLAEGATRARKYRLPATLDLNFNVELFPDSEDAVWKYKVFPKLVLPANVLGICEYGFTEMLNNAIDHSQTKKGTVFVRQNYACVEFFIIDRGIGIFEKIQKACKLDSPQEALLELSKGKLTTYPERHAGEGIYFTSRMFDEFIIRSGLLMYRRRRDEDDDWLVEVQDRARYRKGTLVYMKISTNANWGKNDVFEKYQNDDLRFRRTHVPIALAREPGQQLVSRSQAKRILSRFEQFTEVMLDFRDIDVIGQGFADEIFRIFVQAHPNIPVKVINATPAVARMIDFVRANAPITPIQGQLL